jgi:hypothetical protein
MQNMNCVHASAGPLEGLREKLLWTRNSEVKENHVLSHQQDKNKPYNLFSPLQKHKHAILQQHELARQLMQPTTTTTMSNLHHLEKQTQVISATTLSEWLIENPIVTTKQGERGRVFDLTQCMDTSQAIHFLRTQIVL